MNNHGYKCQSKTLAEKSPPWVTYLVFRSGFLVLPSHLAPQTGANAWRVLCFLDQRYHLLEKMAWFCPSWGGIRLRLIFFSPHLSAPQENTELWFISEIFALHHWGARRKRRRRRRPEAHRREWLEGIGWMHGIKGKEKCCYIILAQRDPNIVVL